MYLNDGVKEYWVVDYMDKEVIKHFDGNETTYKFNDTVKVETLKDLSIDFTLVEKVLFKED